jgi:hypothetical protein
MKTRLKRALFGHLPVIASVVILLVIIGFIGSHKSTTSNTGSTADAHTLITNFQAVFKQKFKSVDSLFCNPTEDGGGCPIIPQSTIAIGPTPNNGPPRKVAGYNFFVSPFETSGVNSPTTELDITTQSTANTKAVEAVFAQQITANKLKTTTGKLHSTAEPTFAGTTYYNNDTLCTLTTGPADTSGVTEGRYFTFSCASIADYSKAAAEVQPLFQAYLAANPKDATEQLAFAPDSASFTTVSKAIGYKRGSAYISLASGDPSGASLFYAKDNSWHLLASNQSLWNCTDPFPNQDAHLAYVGAFCVGSTGTLSTVQ